VSDPLAPQGAPLHGEVLVGGRWFDKPEHIVSRDPATGELLGSAPLCNAEDARLAADEARRAFPGWAALRLEARLECLEALSHLVAREADALAALVTYESGKPIQEAHAVDVLGALDLLRGLLREAPRRLRPVRASAGNPLFWGKRQRVYRVPLGVVAVVSPWNLPLAIPLGQAALALAAGNTVVLKPSEHTPLIAVKLATLFQRAGFPAGVFNLLTGNGETGAALLDTPVDAVLFTGSTATGMGIRRALAGRLVPTLLELGGKDPFLVLPDAPWERTLSGALWNGCFGTGQACSSSERFLVPRAQVESFAEALAVRARGLRMGPGIDPATQVGPLISEAQRDRVAAQVDEARARGARVLCGGAVPSGPGYFYPPTVVVDPPPDCALLREETFGPVIPVLPYGDLDEAVALANDSEFGLSASVWTSDLQKGQEVAARLEVGSVWVNDASYTHGSIACPWGGVKGSGMGRTHWWGTLHDLTHPKLVGVDSGRRSRELWWYPYTLESLEMVREYRQMLWSRGAARFGPAVRAAAAFLRERGRA